MVETVDQAREVSNHGIVSWALETIQPRPADLRQLTPLRGPGNPKYLVRDLKNWNMQLSSGSLIEYDQ